MSPKTLLFGSFDEPDWDKLREAVAYYKNGQYAEAMTQFLALANNGSLMSNVYIGRMYENAESVQKDDEKASEMYFKSAMEDLPTAQFYLAQLQRKLGNYTDALAWHKLAAQSGLVPSMFALSQMYFRGQGTEIDRSVGDQYLLRASACGHIFAQKQHASRMVRGRYGVFKIPFGLMFSIYAFVRGLKKLAEAEEPDLIY